MENKLTRNKTYERWGKMKTILIVLLTILLLVTFSCKNSTNPGDTTPPTVEITNPANNSEFGQGEIVIIEAEANDNKGIEKVEFYIDDTKISTDITEPYQYEWDTGIVKGVNYTIYARAFDTSDNSTNSASIIVIVNENSGTVTDIDGNVYQTLVIGDQEWMVENLKVTHYRNGDPIPHVTDSSQWVNLTTGAYCVYDNDPSNDDTYGNLYNWYAVDDARGLAPAGWHVPTDDEIKELEMYLGMTQAQAESTGYRGTNEGSKLAGGYDLWYNDDLRNDPEFDTSGFCFLPGGYRYGGGYFGGMGGYGYFWSYTVYYSTSAWGRYLCYDLATVTRGANGKRYGFSVRCVRD